MGGACLGVCGASGVGKTLLLRSLADLDRHDGTVLLDGRGSSTYPGPEWRSLVALIPAESRWWYPEFGHHLPSGCNASDARQLLAACGFEDDVLGWQVSRLSTGEKQRLALVRALVRKPAVLLLDETGSGLDLENGLLLEKVVKEYRLAHDAPVIWVSHDREQLARVSRQLLTLQQNRIDIAGLAQTGEGRS